MAYPPSNSTEPRSSSFGLLDRRIQRWIWDKGWTELKDAQEQAIPVILEGRQDVVIAAATASGKTEAAYLPILTRLLEAPEERLSVYISPLKALINDQWGRLDGLCESLEVPVVPWHGDISPSLKKRFQKAPYGCLLITPESLEGMFVRQGHTMHHLFRFLSYVVIDELHAFLDNERGKQLQSLLSRLEGAIGRKVPRIGLSATLGEMRVAAEFLRPENVDACVIESRSPKDLKILIKGFLDTNPNQHQANRVPNGDDTGGLHEKESIEIGEATTGMPPGSGFEAIVEDLYKLRGSKNLIFPNSRRYVEQIADALRERCEKDGVSNEFWPHHGSLSRGIRESAEHALKQSESSATAIATTTLELGIDIGAVKNIVQIGPAPSVASLRQRLGRSGRRAGEPAILRGYCLERALTSKSSVSDQLRESLVQIIAQTRLLLRKWNEPATSGLPHYSTLVQQILSIVAERGGVRATELWETLCQSGVFKSVEREEFVALLRELGRCEYLEQESSGLLLHGRKGELAVNHYTFYAAFTADDEFRIIFEGRSLGTLPLSRPVKEGSYLIFAGRRWLVRQCDAEQRVIEVISARAGRVPIFDGAGGIVHDEVRKEMWCVLSEKGNPGFVDNPAFELLSEARQTFSQLGLEKNRVLQWGNEVRIFTWRGDRVNNTLAAWLQNEGLRAENDGLTIAVHEIDRSRVYDALLDFCESPKADATTLARGISNLYTEKWDRALPESMLLKGYGITSFDPIGSKAWCEETLAQGAA